MNAFTHFEDPADVTGGGVTIIYEDLATGIRAKRFSDMLAVSLGGANDTLPACWRIGLIEIPEIATEIARDAAASEFVILSLRSATNLSTAAKRWIESWLADVREESAGLIVLFDPEQRPPTAGLRRYLRRITARAGVGFFAHWAAGTDGSSFHRPADDEWSMIPQWLRNLDHGAIRVFPISVSV
jgi:hypothetical protein